MTRKAGRHFLQIPGPTNVPDRILRAIDRPIIDHRGPEFVALTNHILSRFGQIFKTKQPVIIYPASGTGAWSAALVNTLSAGDKVLMVETGQFAALWKNVADKLGLVPEFIATDWRHAADPAAIEARLRADTGHQIKAVCIVHNETATGIVSPIREIRAAIDRANHPALYMVDSVSGLGSIDLRHDEWGIDVTISGSQKGLMLPPGLAFNAISQKALAAHRSAKLPRPYWDWSDILDANTKGSFPYTPATGLLYGLDTAIDMLLEEGLEAVFARHERHAAATRAAVASWGLDLLCVDPKAVSSAVTAVLMPAGHNADDLRKVILDRFDLSLGAGLGKLAGKVFRIGHLGDFNDLMLMGTLAGVEMGLELARVPHKAGGVAAAMASLTGTATAKRQAAE